MDIIFEKHRGILNETDNSVIFYGVYFDNILIASKSLKNLIPGEVYYMWCYKYQTGFIHDKTKQIFIDNRWMPNEYFAESYVDTKKIKLY